jgi:tetratricopeptide (TPR) repeat protein
MCSFPVFAFYQESDSQQNVDVILEDASDHLVVLPEKTIAILSQNAHLLNVADKEQQARWHYITLVAAVRAAQLDTVQLALQSLAPLTGTHYYQSHLAQILKGLGIWLRRSGFSNTAKSTYLCSLTYSKNEREKLGAIVNLGVVERNLNNYQRAKEIYTVALEIATKNESNTYIAIIENNLGILAISEHQYDEAQTHFETSLNLNELLKRRSGELLSSMNLLLTFLYQKNIIYFERAKHRAQRKLLLSPDTARAAYFNVLEAIQIARIHPQKLQQSQDVILNNIKLINDIGIQTLLAPLIVDIGVQYEFARPPADAVYKGALLNQFAMCDWQMNSDEANIRLIVAYIAESQFQE